MLDVSREQRVLILLPTRRDAEWTLALLKENGVQGVGCAELAELCREIRLGAGAALLTDEAILGDDAGQLAEVLRDQPAWSALPLVVIAREGFVRHLERASEPLRHATVIERPVRAQTLSSVVLAALRTRQNQYQIRAALVAREQHAAELLANQARLNFALSAAKLGSWELDLASGEMNCSEICKTNYGRPAEEPFSYEQLIASVHPDDRDDMRAAVAKSLAEGTDYDIEYRVLWPDEETHWVMVRGRATYDANGKPLRMVGVSLDVTEQRRMHEALASSQRELAEQADQLRRADRLKDEFLATLAHELRNPLAPIRTGLELLGTLDDPAALKRATAVMQRQLGHMVRLIDDLLDVSRITRGKLELKCTRVQLADIVEAAVETSRPLLTSKGHTLEVVGPAEPVWLYADLTRLAQVIGNLLNNASKYTAPGGKISLVAQRRGREACIEVRDNGIGIARDRLQDVFDMFSQIDPGLDRSQGGLGIGLALVRRLVEMHDGRVSAESEGLGHGSTFRVELPVFEGAEDPPRDAMPKTPVATHRRILVVDDNEDAAELLGLTLTRDGHETVLANDGPAALEAADAFMPEVIVLDIGLPGMSGYEVARALRKDPRFVSTLLIALTGWGAEEDRRRSREAGFDVHLTKPVDAAVLRDAIMGMHPHEA